MKSALTLLLALAAAAHAQFAVMHTNGVVTSPTNLTIQQSNVSGLSNALSGKLATNGSAAGLTGFVGTTNAETARGNLGISNTFAGQFHADFYEDYSRYTNGTTVSNGFTPFVGGPYTLRFGSTNYSNPPRVTNGTLASTNGEIFYLTTELNRPVYNFGAVVEFDQVDGGNNFTLIISPLSEIFGRMLHISVTPVTVGVDITTNGVIGFGGTNTIISENFQADPGSLQTGTQYVLRGQINGDTLTLNWAGRNYQGRHALMTNVVGPFFTHEGFYTATDLTNRIHRVWANSPALSDIVAQPISSSLTALDRGFARVGGNLIVGTNLAGLAAVIESEKALFDGNIRANGWFRGRIGTGTQYGKAPMTHQQGGGTANTNTTNLTDLSEFNIIAGALTNNWSRWTGTYVGSFANNTNAKRVVLAMAGTQLDTGNLNESGEWKMDAIVYRSTNNSHEGFAMFQSQNTTKTARWTFNNGAGVQFNVQAQAAATSNNEVILRGAWADWYP